MRLIDAKNVEELLTSLAMVPNVIIEKWLNEHTVKAIPMEWILNYRKNNQGEITYYTIDAIDHMLCEWCKRNNIDMWDMIDSWEKENE